MSEKKSSLEKKVDKDPVAQAHEQAEKDIEKDPDLNLKPKPGDDLDEGELANFETKD